MPFQAGRKRAEGLLRHRFDLGPQRGQRPPAEQPQHLGVHELRPATGAPASPGDPVAGTRPRTAGPVPTRRRSASVTIAMPRPKLAAGSAATNGPRVLAYRPSSRPSGSGWGSGAPAIPVGRAVPSASRSIGGVGRVRPARLTGDPHPIARRTRANPARTSATSSTALRRSISVGRQRAENPQQIGDLIESASPSILGQALQLGLDVGQRGRVEQVPQGEPVAVAEQLGEQRRVDGERGRPPLGQRRVALVEELRDVAEQQRATRTATGTGVVTSTIRTVRGRRAHASARPAPGTSNTSDRHSRDGLGDDRERRIRRPPPRAAGRPVAAVATAAAACRSACAATTTRGPRTPGTGPAKIADAADLGGDLGLEGLPGRARRTRRNRAGRFRTRHRAAGARCRRRHASPATSTPNRSRIRAEITNAHGACTAAP